MLETEQFLEQLADRGFTHFCAVPCSFAQYLINAAINHPQIEYVAAANEAVACSIAAGLKMSGAKPMVLAQSSGLTNMGSCITSLLKPYGIHIPMIVSWRSYSAGDSEIQHQHLADHLPDLIAAYGYEWELLDRSQLQTAVMQVVDADARHSIVILQPDTFSEVDLHAEHKLELGAYPRRSEYLASLNKAFGESDTMFIGTTGHTAREMFTYMPDARNFYMAGNMGGALSVGYGASLSGRQVIVCGGDAEHLMHLGGMATAAAGPAAGSLLYIVFDNRSNKSTGGQTTNNSQIDYAGLAASLGFSLLGDTVKNLSDFRLVLARLPLQSKPAFLHVMCDYDPVTPRPPAEAICDSVQAFLPDRNKRS